MRMTDYLIEAERNEHDGLYLSLTHVPCGQRVDITNASGNEREFATLLDLRNRSFDHDKSCGATS